MEPVNGFPVGCLGMVGRQLGSFNCQSNKDFLWEWSSMILSVNGTIV